jgi:heparan-alpha-glucosaminide N-acetyltransferase
MSTSFAPDARRANAKTGAPASSAPQRLLSLDAFRGLVMLAMASDGLRIAQVARNFPSSPTWQFIAYHFDHVPWVGCALWDMIQPSFMFMVGTSMAFSYAGRQARGDSYGKMLRHAMVRALVLVVLGIFLRSRFTAETNFTFEDVLTQIGLGYIFLFLLWGRSLRVQLLAAIAILVGYWALFFLWPLPPADYNWQAVGVPADWPHLTGNSAHWDKNANPGHYFDQWFLNLFPRSQPFVFNSGGYLTLSFIPSLATMIFGLMSGELLRSNRSPRAKIGWLLGSGIVLIGAGVGLHVADLCPIVKRIWTPSWALYSAGWVCIALASFYAIVDVAGWRRWTFPFVVVGMNSIVMYCMAELLPDWIHHTLQVHFGSGIFKWAPAEYQPLVTSALILFTMWLICYWLYRQRIFVRI